MIPRQRAVLDLAVALAAVLMLSYLGLSGLARAGDQPASPAASEDCDRDNMPAEMVRACAQLIGSDALDVNDRVRVFTLRGMSWLKEEEPAAAVSEFDRALKINPDNIAALNGRARAHVLLKQHDRAIEDWSRIARFHPDDEENYRNRGASWLAAGKTNEALADYTKAIEINPKSIEAYIGRAAVYEKQDDRKMALRDLELAQEANPTSLDPFMARAETAERWGDHAMAIENYQQVVKRGPQDSNMYRAIKRLGDMKR